MVCGSLEIEILNTFWNLTAIDEDVDISIQDVVDELSKTAQKELIQRLKLLWTDLLQKAFL